MVKLYITNLKVGPLLAGFSFFFLFSNCNPKKNTIVSNFYNPTLVSSFAIPKISGMFVRPLNLKILNDSVLSFTDNTWQRIHFYNKKSDSLFQININFRTNKQYITQYEFLENDRILIAFLSTYLADQHDSCLMIYNLKSKKIERIFDFDSTNVILSSNLQSKKYRHSSYVCPFYFPLKIGPEGKVVLPVSSMYAPCDSNLQNRKFSDLIIVRSKDSKISGKSVPLFYPCNCKINGEDFFYSHNTKMMRGCTDFSNNYLMSFGINNTIWKYNVSTDVLIEEKSTPWFLHETPCKDKEIESDIDKETIEYEEIIHDTYRNQFLRVVRLPVSKNDPVVLYNYPHLGVIIMDSLLNVIGFSKLPFGVQRPIIASEKGIIAYNSYTSRNSEAFIMEEYALEKGSKIVEKFDFEKADSVQINTIDWAGYFSALDSNINSMKDVILIPITNSCQPCLTTMGEYLNTVFMEDTTIAKVFIADSKLNLDKYFKQNKIKPNGSYYYDYKSEYMNYLKDLYNIHIVQKRNNDYIFKRYGPDDLPFLPKNLGFSYEIKKMELKCTNCK